MGLELVTSGKNLPEEINVVIEIPKDSEPVKYEVDKASGAIFVDRILSTRCVTLQLWLRAQHPVRRWRPGRRAGGAAVAAGAGLGGALPPGRRATHERRGR